MQVANLIESDTPRGRAKFLLELEKQALDLRSSYPSARSNCLPV